MFQLISSPYLPAYSINVLAEEKLVAEKISALLSRRKPRDYYDLYFILRSRLPKKPAIEKKSEIIKAVNLIDDSKTKRELKAFLPASHWPILANFKKNLQKEITQL